MLFGTRDKNIKRVETKDIKKYKKMSNEQLKNEGFSEGQIESFEFCKKHKLSDKWTNVILSKDPSVKKEDILFLLKRNLHKESGFLKQIEYLASNGAKSEAEKNIYIWMINLGDLYYYMEDKFDEISDDKKELIASYVDKKALFRYQIRFILMEAGHISKEDITLILDTCIKNNKTSFANSYKEELEKYKDDYYTNSVHVRCMMKFVEIYHITDTNFEHFTKENYEERFKEFLKFIEVDEKDFEIWKEEDFDKYLSKIKK